MMHAKQALLASAAMGLLVVAAVACSANADATFGDSAKAEDSGTRPGTDEGAATPSTTSVAASGIVLVHAASFPSFRLCFENFLDQKPQPDSDIMPESNLVGVETGSFVRLPPMAAPGVTYVIDERRVRGTSSTCRQLVKGSSPPLVEVNDYNVLREPLKAPLGNGSVDVVAISGCASSGTLFNLGISQSTCADDYDINTGNLHAHVIPLRPSRTGLQGQTLPVQLYQLSTAIDAVAGDTLSVSFGDLSGAGSPDQPLAVPALFATGVQTTVSFDPSSEAVYGTHGFRISVGATGSVTTVDQTLAAVQDLSSSNEVPSTYYGAASNYALLLLGDPRVGEDAGAAGARSRMHLLAVPVIDPSTVDAGTDASAPDGG